MSAVSVSEVPQAELGSDQLQREAREAKHYETRVERNFEDLRKQHMLDVTERHELRATHPVPCAECPLKAGRIKELEAQLSCAKQSWSEATTELISAREVGIQLGRSVGIRYT